MTQLLLNIKSVMFIDAGRLRNIDIIPGKGVMLKYRRYFSELPLANLASMEVVSKVENKSRIFTTTIKALLTDHFDVANRKLAFLVTTVNGLRFLVGSAESPFPVVNTSDAFPDKPADQSGCSLTVEFSDSVGLLPVID